MAWDAEGRAAAEEIMRRRGAHYGSAHAVFVVLDDIDNGQLPQRGHVEAFRDLTLIHGTITHEGQANAAIVPVVMREGEAGADRHLCTDDAVPAEEIFLAREH